MYIGSSAFLLADCYEKPEDLLDDIRVGAQVSVSVFQQMQDMGEIKLN